MRGGNTGLTAAVARCSGSIHFADNVVLPQRCEDLFFGFVMSTLPLRAFPVFMPSLPVLRAIADFSCAQHVTCGRLLLFIIRPSSLWPIFLPLPVLGVVLGDGVDRVPMNGTILPHVTRPTFVASASQSTIHFDLLRISINARGPVILDILRIPGAPPLVTARRLLVQILKHLLRERHHIANRVDVEKSTITHFR